MNTLDNKCCTPTSQRSLTIDLSLLNQQAWLSLELLEYFSSLQNKSGVDSSKVSMANLIALNRSGKLHDTVKDWKEGNIKRVCIIMIVGKDKIGDTYLADKNMKGNHWTCLLLDISC